LLPQYTHLLFTHVTPYSVIVSWKNIHVNIICKITHPTLITTKWKREPTPLLETCYRIKE
jgi:hypothetical protein